MLQQAIEQYGAQHGKGNYHDHAEQAVCGPHCMRVADACLHIAAQIIFQASLYLQGIGINAVIQLPLPFAQKYGTRALSILKIVEQSIYHAQTLIHQPEEMVFFRFFEFELKMQFLQFIQVAADGAQGIFHQGCRGDIVILDDFFAQIEIHLVGLVYHLLQYGIHPEGIGRLKGIFLQVIDGTIGIGIGEQNCANQHRQYQKYKNECPELRPLGFGSFHSIGGTGD